ncbi:PP2C family protein-serine/threonine phosphatase [Acanthopleuribacter pedis]|uniref:SpoIIE family protein phosphatase n=1 Tax=Acanthopleuribacter pedis TaxID=442870 RepID=A0A8J7U275_9BACT|nr:SpoIIE family protein phosphatase [Acanthopleuribacter pedis]MBO1316978.1 SpoIIE family protein phosphatase [Acanthopleuribacter pedis]
MKILIAEDDRITLKMLTHHLERWGHTVLTADDGERAWELLNRHQDIFLLITDWMMPRMNGLQLCRLVRGLKRDRHIHIIMLSAKEEKSDLLEGMEAGADAFIHKPLNLMEFKAQLRVAERITRLEAKLSERFRDLQKAHEELQHDLEAAGKIQRSLLPDRTPNIRGVQPAWAFQSCEAVAGDMLNIFYLDEHRMGMYILDVSGHGVQAALLSVSLSRVLTPFAQYGGILKRRLNHPPYYEIPDVIEVAKTLNRRFPVMEQSGQFFTFLYGILDLACGRFRFVRAGHPGPLFVSHKTIQTFEDGGGPPIGIFDDPNYEAEEIEMHSGDYLIAYTDGLVETANEAGALFGDSKLMQLLKYCAYPGAETAIADILSHVKRFAGKKPFDDDMSMVGFTLD